MSEVNLHVAQSAVVLSSSFQANLDSAEHDINRGRTSKMTSKGGTFLLPDRLEPDLERVHAYWNGLKRGDNDVPFWDDVKFSMQARLAREVMVIEAFENPLRFRFDLVGEDLTRRYGAAVAGKFIDEVDLHPPIDQLIDQCRATVERRAPTYFRHVAADGGMGYSRLVLPLWGRGRIEMLIGAGSWQNAA